MQPIIMTKYFAIEMRFFRISYKWQPLKTSFDKNQLCTAYAVSSTLGGRQPAIGHFPCLCRAYLIFVLPNRFLEVAKKILSEYDGENK